MTAAEIEADAKRKREVAAARAAQLKRGPGVAALVQGALKRAQTAVAVKKTKEEETEKEDKDDKMEQGLKVDSTVNEVDLTREKQQDEVSEAARELTVEKMTRKEEEAAAERARKEEEEKERELREQREAIEREMERARREAEEAERERERAEQEDAAREARVKAGVEAAKRKQAERERGEMEKNAAARGTLYGDIPQPNLGDEATMNDERRKEANQTQNRSNLPPEDRNKIIFLDIDGVLRPARAGGFDILPVDGAQVQPDTSDFFPSAMRALRHIVERTGAVIVLSSEWRRSEALLQAVDGILQAQRLRPCIGTTVSDAEKELGTADPVRAFAERRAREISAWLREHEEEVKGWCVIDDINLALADDDKKGTTKSMGPKLVQTWPLCGLTMGNAKTAVRILNGEIIHKVLVERPKAPTVGNAASPAAKISGVATPTTSSRH